MPLGQPLFEGANTQYGNHRNGHSAVGGMGDHSRHGPQAQQQKPCRKIVGDADQKAVQQGITFLSSEKNAYELSVEISKLI